MPGEQGYQRQVAPRPAAALPQVSPAAFGAELADTIGAAAQTAHKQALDAYAIQRRETANSEWAKFQHDYALYRDTMDGVAREARKDGSAGHAERMAQAWDAGRDGLLDGITEDSVRQRASALFDEGRLQFHTGEAEFEDVRRSAKVVSDFEATQDVQFNRIRRLEKPEDYLHEMEIGHAAIDGLDTDSVTKEKLRRAYDRGGAIAFIQGRTDEDPAMAKALLKSGAYDAVLTPDDVDKLLNRTDIEIRSRDVEARRVQAEQTASVKESIASLEEADRQGIAVPDEQYTAAIKAAQAIGDDSKALHIEGLQRNAAFAKVYEKATPLQREARRSALAGMGKRSPDEDRELKWLEDHSGPLDSKFNSDPAGFAAQSGEAPPPLTDPVGRARWARERSQAYGRPVPPLTANEAAQLQSEYRSGRPGQIEVLGLISRMPARQAAEAARQVDPNDATLPVMATLPEAYRSLALDGRDALKGNPKLLKSDDDKVKDAIAEHERRFAQAMRAVPPAQRNAILAVAGRIAAGSIDRSGGEMTANLYFSALNMALGASGTGASRRGGLGRWGEDWFVLPTGVSGTAFGRAVYAEARNGRNKPVNPDGSPASLKALHPVAVGNGFYEFRDRGENPVVGSDGKPWTVKVTGQ